MQLSINIEDGYYQRFLDFVKTLPSDAIKVFNDEKNRIYFQNSLNEINSGKAKLVAFDDGLDELDDFIDAIK